MMDTRRTGLVGPTFALVHIGALWVRLFFLLARFGCASVFFLFEPRWCVGGASIVRIGVVSDRLGASWKCCGGGRASVWLFIVQFYEHQSFLRPNTLWAIGPFLAF